VPSLSPHDLKFLFALVAFSAMFALGELIERW